MMVQPSRRLKRLRTARLRTTIRHILQTHRRPFLVNLPGHLLGHLPHMYVLVELHAVPGHQVLHKTTLGRRRVVAHAVRARQQLQTIKRIVALVSVLVFHQPGFRLKRLAALFAHPGVLLVHQVLVDFQSLFGGEVATAVRALVRATRVEVAAVSVQVARMSVGRVAALKLALILATLRVDVKVVGQRLGRDEFLAANVAEEGVGLDARHGARAQHFWVVAFDVLQVFGLADVHFGAEVAAYEPLRFGNCKKAEKK
jgi:hypothetical protein